MSYDEPRSVPESEVLEIDWTSLDHDPAADEVELREAAEEFRDLQTLLQFAAESWRGCRCECTCTRDAKCVVHRTIDILERRGLLR